MFQLLRRISGSVFPRNDRPWADDGVPLFPACFSQFASLTGPRTATSTAPTIGRKRRLSSVDMNIGDPPAGSLSKKSRRGTDGDASEDEEPASSPVTSSPPPPRSSPPPEDVKEVTTGVKEIQLDQKPNVPLSDSSEVVEPPATLATETPAPADEGVKTPEEDPTPEHRSGEADALDVEGSRVPSKGDATDEIPVKPTQKPTDDSKDIAKDTASLPTTAEEPVTLEDKPEVTA